MRKTPVRKNHAPPLSPEEEALFRAAVTDVRPLRHEPISMAPRKTGLPPRRRVSPASGVSFLEPSEAELSEADHLEFRRPGLQPALWRRLRRGEFPLEATLDLHGQTVDEARQRLGQFIRRGVEEGLKCVRVVHGKGYRSPGLASVLKPRVAFWLSHLGEVTAFISARPADGGTGALYVLLKR
ncbi:MAG: Smr/MutS family protein, partial [Gammaproteobacteria bacterium]|nr:Smr/MutS family protein [Gammaproteobacteria bacterium]